jgi:SAM-dependent methyltransferase
MVEGAKRKLSESGLGEASRRVRFEVGDIETARVGSEFDAAIIMFAVLGYLRETDRVVRALRNVRQQLRTGALLVADFWYGPAVMRTPPGERVRVIELEDRTVIRATRAELDAYSQVVAVHFSLFDVRDSAACRKSAETHLMRYFFPQELQLLCNLSGFSVRSVCAFPNIEQKPDDSTWNAGLIAEAI